MIQNGQVLTLAIAPPKNISQPWPSFGEHSHQFTLPASAQDDLTSLFGIQTQTFSVTLLPTCPPSMTTTMTRDPGPPRKDSSTEQEQTPCHHHPQIHDPNFAHQHLTINHD
ncbi:hypothetical protein SLE2022_112200 [Rubroshorea leprosula]